MRPRTVSLLLCATVVSWHAAFTHPLAECEWCGAADAPNEVTSVTTIADEDEPGEPLVLRGTVYAPDKMTAVPGVLLYVYHTNTAGIYPKRGNEAGNGRRHGYLRGWVISDENGEFEVRTIRPGTYPSRSEPAHIHMTVKEPNRAEYWIDNILFEGDPLITQKVLDRRTGRGGPAIVAPARDPNGGLVIRRDVILAEPSEVD